MGQGKLVHPVRYGLHGSCHPFQVGDLVLPSGEHHRTVNYNFSDERFTYFLPIPDDADDQQLLYLLGTSSNWCGWPERGSDQVRAVWLTRPLGPQFLDKNMGDGLARICEAQRICHRMTIPERPEYKTVFADGVSPHDPLGWMWNKDRKIELVDRFKKDVVMA